MDAMPCMAQRSGSAATLHLTQAGTCSHSVCAVIPALAGERNPILAPPALGPHAVLNTVSLFVPSGVQSPAYVRGPPPIRIASPVALHILVRV